jgi:metal-dependent amidase/aminoacylase/carboxypeptidase family protein
MKDRLEGKNRAKAWIDHHCKEFFASSDCIWNLAELGCEEFLSSQLLVNLLKSHDFQTQLGLAGMPTALIMEKYRPSMTKHY